MILISVLLLSTILPVAVQATSSANPSFLLSAHPNKLTLSPNSSQISMVNVTAVNGFAGTVDLSAASAAGVVVTLNPMSLQLNSTIQVMSSALRVNASASVGAYPVTITASAQGVPSESVALTVIVAADTIIPCGSFGNCLILSDTRISGPSYNGGMIHFAATGLPGASGFANVTIPRAATSNITDTHVLVNGAVLPGNSVTITGNGLDYFIFFNFTFHSPVNVDIQLSESGRSSNPLGISQILVFAGIAGVFAIATIGIGAVVAVRRKKRARMSISTHSPKNSVVKD
jgi:hypothetical protein